MEQAHESLLLIPRRIAARHDCAGEDNLPAARRHRTSGNAIHAGDVLNRFCFNPLSLKLAAGF
jgi:hypothetical protein